MKLLAEILPSVSMSAQKFRPDLTETKERRQRNRAAQSDGFLHRIEEPVLVGFQSLGLGLGALGKYVRLCLCVLCVERLK